MARGRDGCRVSGSSGKRRWISRRAQPIPSLLQQMRSGQTQRSRRSAPRMVEAVGVDDGFDTLGKGDAFGVSFKASTMPAAEKGDGATRLPHVWKPRPASTFQRTDQLTGVTVDDIVDKTPSRAPIDLGDLDVHRFGPHRLGNGGDQAIIPKSPCVSQRYDVVHRFCVNCFTSSCGGVPQSLARGEKRCAVTRGLAGATQLSFSCQSAIRCIRLKRVSTRVESAATDNAAGASA